MSVERQFLRDTATEPGTDGNTGIGGIFDLSTVQGTPATLGSGNTSSTTFVLGKRFQKTVNDTVIGTSFPISINMASVSASTLEWQAKVQRINSSNVVQAESDILGPFNTAGIKTGTLTLSTTWAAGDRLAVAIEIRKVSGGGNRSFSLNVNDADSSVDPDIASQTEEFTGGDTVSLTEALVKQAQKVFGESVILTEALTAVKVVVKDIGDTVSLVENFAGQVNKALGETVAITESRLFQVLRTVSDSLGLTESASKTVIKTLPESVGLTEALETVVEPGAISRPAPTSLKISISLGIR